MEEFVLTRMEGNVLTIILNRPEKLYALNLEFLQALAESMESARVNEEVRGIVLTGAGDNFCAGADVEFIEQVTSADVWRNTLLECKRLVEAIRHMPKPVMSKVKGYAAGAGCNIALSADFVVASDNAWFYEAFIHLGAILDCGGPIFCRDCWVWPKQRQWPCLEKGSAPKKLKGSALFINVFL